jgi:L-aspartate oxidase
MQSTEPILTQGLDVIVVGSGIAGLFLAVKCAKAGLKVVVITKKEISTSSTNWAQGGIAGVLDVNNKESLEKHVKDTLDCGAGLCNEAVVRSVVNEAAHRITDLVNHGVRFDIGSEGKYDMNKEGGHSEERILHSKDRTGAEIERALTNGANNETNSNLKILENWMAVDLIQKSHGDPSMGVAGIWCLDPQGKVQTISSTCVVLATGGAGILHEATTNPKVATGDGVAMAKRVGAEIRDMEFIQFHPTALASDNSTPFLITEALRGHGAVLMTKEDYINWKKNNKNNLNDFSYMRKYSSLGSLGTRDIVARATDFEMKKSGEKHVLLITEHLNLEELHRKFPTITRKLIENNIIIGKNPIPVTPAAHYMVGGIAVNEHGQAKYNGQKIENLFAIGEVACTGLHGANRLASNSLLEAVVYADRAANNIIQNIDLNDKKFTETLPMWRAENLDILTEHAPLRTDTEALRSTMTSDVGIVKSNSRLKRAKRRISHISNEVELVWRTCKPSQEILELRNLVEVAELVIDASMKRKENIGLHYNKDLEE